MPLRDHFCSPVNDTHSWDEVHGGWPMEIVRDLKTILPVGFRAAPKVREVARRTFSEYHPSCPITSAAWATSRVA
jgi:hypothetical protein